MRKITWPACEIPETREALVLLGNRKRQANRMNTVSEYENVFGVLIYFSIILSYIILLIFDSLFPFIPLEDIFDTIGNRILTPSNSAPLLHNPGSSLCYRD